MSRNEAGAVSLESLPGRVEACAARWGLAIGRRLAAQHHWVAEARRADGTAVVLKLAPAWEEGLCAEASALSRLDGIGAVQLLDAAPGLGALLLERLRPGATLEGLVLAGEDERATRIAAEVMKRLWRPAPAQHSLPTVCGWGEGFARHRRAHGGGSGPLDARLFAQAEAVFAELAASQAPRVLLHGDLHHGNVLAATREPWLAIDPKGVAGEPAYEPGALLRNPFPHLLGLPDPRRLTARRLEVLAGALGLDRERLRAWAFAQAVLSAVWHVEDSDDGDGRRFAMGCAALLERV